MTALSPAQRDALARIAQGGLYVGRDPGRPLAGSGINPGTLRALLRDGLIARGPYQPGRGRPLHLTPDGQNAHNDRSTE